MTSPVAVLLSISLLFASISTLAQPGASAPTTQTGANTTIQATASPAFEREKFEHYTRLEAQKLEIERLKAWATGGSILVPLLIGVFTLWWQTRAAAKLRDREARDLFELKAAEILFEGDNSRATKNRAKALTNLFPGRFPEGFGDAFEPTQFGGPRYEAKLEVFRAACTKVSTPEDVYRVWHSLFPGDQWIKPLVGNASAEQTPGPSSAA